VEVTSDMNQGTVEAAEFMRQGTVEDTGDMSQGTVEVTGDMSQTQRRLQSSCAKAQWRTPGTATSIVNTVTEIKQGNDRYILHYYLALEVVCYKVWDIFFLNESAFKM
jgi:hypothetical protein